MNNTQVKASKKQTTTVSNGQAMTNKELIGHIKALINYKTSLPILETVYLHGDQLTISDLETFVTLPYKSGIEACVPAPIFMSALDMMKQPTFECNKDWDVIIKENTRRLRAVGDDPENFPRNMLSGNIQYNQVGEWGQNELSYLEAALDFVSKDDLRPAMTGVFAGKHIAATDAHRLYWKNIDPLMEEMIIRAKTARILIGFGERNWKVFVGIEYSEAFVRNDGSICEPQEKARYAAFVSDDGIAISFRPIDARFPQYEVVIPEGEGNVAMTTTVKELRNELKDALKFANKATNQIVITLNGCAKISSADLDLKQEYENEFNAEYEIKNHKELKDQYFAIAYNAKFLDDILAQLDIKKKKDEEEAKVTFKLWSPTKATVISDCYLIMPLMLNS